MLRLVSEMVAGMAVISIAASESNFERWKERVRWVKEPSGSRLNVQMGARAAWALGHVWVLVPDDKPMLATNVPILLQRAFGGKAALNPPDVPTEVTFMLGLTAPEPAPRAGHPAVAMAPPVPEEEPVPEEPEDDDEPIVEADDEGVAVAEGEATVATAQAAAAAAQVGSEIGGAVESAAEEAAKALEVAREKRRAAIARQSGEAALEIATSEEEREASRRLTEIGITVGDNPVPTGGYRVGISIVATTKMSRAIERTKHTRKFFKRLGDKEGIVENARRRSRRFLDGEGGTPFMGSKLVPVSRLNAVLRTLQEHKELFHREVEQEIGGNREQINEEIRAAIREHEGKEAGGDDLIPEDVTGMFDFRVEIARMSIPRVQELEEVEVEFETAKAAIDNVLKTSREVTEKSVLRRFAPAYKSLAVAWEAVGQGKRLPTRTKTSLLAVVRDIEDADTTKNPVVRAELEKFRAYVEFVLEAAKAADLSEREKAEAKKRALAKTLTRVTRIHNATAPLHGKGEVAAPTVADEKDGLKAVVAQVKRDMEANEKRYGLSMEPAPGERGKASEPKVHISKVPMDGSPESARKAWLAYAQQFERMMVKG